MEIKLEIEYYIERDQKYISINGQFEEEEEK